jgi:hypothetical protein
MALQILFDRMNCCNTTAEFSVPIDERIIPDQDIFNGG